MYRNLLVATDGSARAGKALKAALRMARASGARLCVLNVQPTYLATVALAPEAALTISKVAFERSTRRASGRVLGAAQKLAQRHGVRCRLMTEASDDVAGRIVRTAKKLRADLIVMASHGRGGLAALVLGSVTQKVLAGCRIPVLVHR